MYNLIISGFADFCHVENFLESFSLIHHDSTGFVHFARIVFFNPIMPAIARSRQILSSGYSRSASLRSSTPNNCSAVYQEELALLLIEASPHTLLIAFRNPAGDLLDLVKPCLLTYSPFFVKVKALKQRVDFSVPTFFATQPAPFEKGQVVWLLLCKKSTLCFPHLISIRF